jgi:uncharacterized membrane protein YeaQ/YmgE (transglycosylase-associated protein family)
MYVTLPDVASARKLADDLLLARIEDRHMHFLARRGTDLSPLHECSYLEKTDAIPGAFKGAVIGGVLGIVVGALLVQFPMPDGRSMELITVLVAAIIGALLGAWISSMMGLQVPNTRLKPFYRDLDEGKVLLMLDVPSGRYQEVREIIARTHPEAVDGGNEPTVPAFP